MSFGDHIKQMREKDGIPLRTMARMVGVDIEIMRLMESGGAYPNPDMLDRIAYILDVDPFGLFTPAEYEMFSQLNTAIMRGKRKDDLKQRLAARDNAIFLKVYGSVETIDIATFQYIGTEECRHGAFHSRTN